MASEQVNFLSGNFSSILSTFNTIKENAAIIYGQNATSCYEISKNVILEKMIDTSEKIQNNIEKQISGFERLIHDKIWVGNLLKYKLM